MKTFGTIFLIFSGILMVVSIGALAIFGLDMGIEFTGGSLLEVEYEQGRPENSEVVERIAQTGVQVGSVQPIGEKGLVIRMPDISEETHQEVVGALGGEATELRFEVIGPVIGKELREKSLILAALSLLAIVLYVMFAFRKIVRPVRSWQWSLAALAALVHDILIPLGILAVLGEYMGVSVTIPVVVALLIVVGYSVNDTVVVFDRIRENIVRKTGFDFSDTVAISVRQTFSRSFFTSFTTLLVVASLFFLGGETLRHFSLVMILGIMAGTYSSLFLAPVLMARWGRRVDS